MKFLIIFACITIAYAAIEAPPGGATSVADPEVQSTAVKLLNDNLCNLDGCWELVKIEKVSSQIVAGVKYYITGIFQEVEEEKKYRLTVSIWSKPWENFIQLTVDSKKALSKKA